MLIKELPGVYFDEKVAYELTGEGSKIPIFIGRTGNSAKSYYTFVSYGSEDSTEELGRGEVETDMALEGDYYKVKVISNSTVQDFVGQEYYVSKDIQADGKQRSQLYEGAGTNPTGMYVTVEKVDSYSVDGKTYLKFNKISNALRDVIEKDDTTSDIQWREDTGIGRYYSDDGKTVVDESNELSRVIYEFYQESKLLQSTDIGVPYFYVIDVGDGTDITAWENALETAKALIDAQVEVYVGAEDITGTDLEHFIYKAVDSIFKDTVELDLRYGFTTTKQKFSETLEDYDTRIMRLANNLRSNYSSALSKLSRFGLCEDLLFGKTIARICCTPYNTEPGFYKYRSVEPDTFHKRTKERMLSLQNAGIIFNRDEQVNGKKLPRINLCVSCSFGTNTDRPADSLFHARFNSDDLLREVFEVCYTQIKANESETNIAYLQTRINKLVNDRVTNEEMIKYDDRTEIGTKLTVVESLEEPYNLIVTGQIQPVKCTIAIKVEAEIRI